MQISSVVSYIVSIFAVPWAHHMKYLMGHSTHLNTLGFIIHTVGTPACYVVGRAHNMMMTTVSTDISATVSLLLLFFTSFLLAVTLHAIITKKKSAVAEVFQSSLNHLLFYFHAMGRRM